jgi:hypothetical protein
MFDTVTLEVKTLPDRVYALFGPGADYMRIGTCCSIKCDLDIEPPRGLR